MGIIINTMAANTSQNRTGMVMDAIRTRIESRALATGDRLPSIRACATTLSVSPSTVVEAYDRLAAEGLIRARRGSGFYVATAAPPLVLSEIGPRLDRELDPYWVSRQSLDAGASAAMPGCGWLPADSMPNDAMRRALRKIARGNASTLTDYGSTRGPVALRALLAKRFAAEALDVGPDRILLTGSGTQAIDLICRFLLRPDDTVLVDDPCYFNFQALLRAHQAKVVGVPLAPTGPDVERFAEAVREHRPRLYITNSALQNPTGATLSPQTAHRILSIAAAHGVTIVEDDIFADFEPEPSPRFSVLDGLSSVIRIGSFSKTLSASVRCGFIAARADWIEALIDLQVATSFGGVSPVSAEIVLLTLGDGTYRKHLENLRQRLAHTRLAVAEKLGDLGIAPWLMPRGGFYLWCTLPDGRDAAALARAALAENVVLAPGNVFSVSQGAASFMRFNVAQMGQPRIYDTLRRALATSS